MANPNRRIRTESLPPGYDGGWRLLPRWNVVVVVATAAVVVGLAAATTTAAEVASAPPLFRNTPDGGLVRAVAVVVNIVIPIPAPV
jgi:hypothetical protein